MKKINIFNVLEDALRTGSHNCLSGVYFREKRRNDIYGLNPEKIFFHSLPFKYNIDDHPMRKDHHRNLIISPQLYIEFYEYLKEENEESQIGVRCFLNNPFAFPPHNSSKEDHMILDLVTDFNIKDLDKFSDYDFRIKTIEKYSDEKLKSAIESNKLVEEVEGYLSTMIYFFLENKKMYKSIEY